MPHGEVQILVKNDDMSAELQSLSTQVYFMLVVVLNNQAQEIVRNFPEGIGAEVWRKLLWDYEPDVGMERCCNRY